MTLEDLIHECHKTSAEHGWWLEPRNKGEAIALMHSELSEMLEGVRKPAKDEHCPMFSSEEIELADLIIRAFDYAEGFNLRLEYALEAKMAFNKTRPHKHGKAF
jgi:NTP pyrophosphatase (non-canonical NTP hydrolase)